MKNRPITFGLAILIAFPGVSVAREFADESLQQYRSAIFSSTQPQPQAWRHSDIEFRASSDAYEVWNTGDYVNGSFQIKQGQYSLDFSISADDMDGGLEDDSEDDRLIGSGEDDQEIGWYDMKTLRATYRYAAGNGLNLAASWNNDGRYNGTMNYRLSKQWRFTGYMHSNTDSSYGRFYYRPFRKLQLSGRMRADGDLYGQMNFRPKPGWRLNSYWRADDNNNRQRVGSYVRYSRGLAELFKPTLGVDFYDYHYDNANNDYTQRNVWFGVFSELFDYALEVSAKYTVRNRDYLTDDSAGSNFGRSDRGHVFTLSSWYSLENFDLGIDLNFRNRDSTRSNLSSTYYDVWLELEKTF